MSDAPKKPDRGDVESAIMDAMGDVRVLHLVLTEANESPRNDAGKQPVMMVPEETFLSWMHTCNRLSDSVREAERVFYAAKL